MKSLKHAVSGAAMVLVLAGSAYANPTSCSLESFYSGESGNLRLEVTCNRKLKKDCGLTCRGGVRFGAEAQTNAAKQKIFVGELNKGTKNFKLRSKRRNAVKNNDGTPIGTFRCHIKCSGVDVYAEPVNASALVCGIGTKEIEPKNFLKNLNLQLEEE